MRTPLGRLHAVAFAAAALSLTAPAARAQGDSPTGPSAPSDGAAWRQDLEWIASELPARHPDLFFRMSRASWDSAVGAIDGRLASMTRYETLVAFMELVALPSDGHTSITPLFDPGFHVRYYPVELYAFDDGLYVRSAAPEHASLAGAKVLRIGRASAEDALAAAARTVPHENEWWARAWAPGRLEIPEVLDGLGLVADMEALPLVVERGGRADTVLVRPAGRLEPRGHDPAGPIDRSGWTDMRDPGEPPLWLRNPGRPYWAEFVADDGTLYVAYRGVVDAEPGNVAFWRQVFAMADSLPVERLVIDIRENTGGESFFNRQVVRGIVARPTLDDPERLFVVLGRRTFSAAMNLALDLERWTNATFVGEPTGNATMFFGDHERIALPASGFTVNVSTLPWHPDDPRDHRPFLAPDIFTPLTAADYRAGVDPAMRAILARGAEPRLAERVEAALVEGDSTAAQRIVEGASRDVANRFRSPEADVNALGYRMLRSGRVSVANAVFRLNTRVFPMSANVWDSLGEALLAADRRDEAIASYRRALEIDPEFASATQALARLGVQ
jgi:hypothetical protein